MTVLDGHPVGDDAGAANTVAPRYTVTPRSYLVDFVTDRLAVEVSVAPSNRTVDTLWVVADGVVTPLWRPSRGYSDEQLSAGLHGAAAFIRHSPNLQYRVGRFPAEVLPVDARVELPTVD